MIEVFNNCGFVLNLFCNCSISFRNLNTSLLDSSRVVISSFSFFITLVANDFAFSFRDLYLLTY